MALSSTLQLSPLEGRRLIGVLPYTPVKVAVPADTANDASSMLIFVCHLFCLTLDFRRRY